MFVFAVRFLDLIKPVMCILPEVAQSDKKVRLREVLPCKRGAYVVVLCATCFSRNSAVRADVVFYTRSNSVKRLFGRC
jgi:hypothetical protein